MTGQRPRSGPPAGARLAVVGGTGWAAPGEGRAVAWKLHDLGWQQLAHRPHRDTGVEAEFVRGWLHVGGRARSVADLEQLIRSEHRPDLLVAFVAERGDYAARLVDVAEEVGWPPVWLHHAAGVYPWPARKAG